MMGTAVQAGWESKKLAELLSFEQPSRYLVTSTQQLTSGRIPVLTAGKTFVLGYTNDDHGIYQRHPVIIFDDFTTASQFVDFDFKAKSSAMKILSARPGLANVLFMYERMQMIEFPLGDHKRHWISEYSQLRVDVPRVEEQNALAEIISDLSQQTAALERLIAKKQAIRQGLLQQLLTGKTRLPGFTGPRETFRLRDLGSTYGGLTGKTKDDFGRGSATFVTFLEVITSTRLTGRHLERVRVRKSERQNRVIRGDLLFNGSSETPEEVALSAVVAFDPSPTTYLNSFCFGYRIKRLDLADPTFLAYFFRSNGGRDIIASLAQGATRYNIAKTKFLELAPALPNPDEQRAIVAVLNDCDVEIESCRSRLAKAKAIKRGMMQELLTGRTRLAVSEGAA